METKRHFGYNPLSQKIHRRKERKKEKRKEQKWLKKQWSSMESTWWKILLGKPHSLKMLKRNNYTTDLIYLIFQFPKSFRVFLVSVAGQDIGAPCIAGCLWDLWMRLQRTPALPFELSRFKRVQEMILRRLHYTAKVALAVMCTQNIHDQINLKDNWLINWLL